MARDDHPRARQARALERKKGKRPPYARVLIVCEGEKTEPNYFDEIRVQLRIPTAHVHVIPTLLGTQPRQVVDSAEKVFLERREFDAVYAVFDRDDHTTYPDALAQADRLNGKHKNDEGTKVAFHAVPSVPCFELWILLHIRQVLAFNHRDQIIAAVADVLPGYAKGMKGVFGKTQGQLAAATARAAQLRQQFGPFAGTDPYTTVDELVARLLALKPPAAAPAPALDTHPPG